MADTRYWATLPPDELAGAVWTRIRDWRRYHNATGMAEKAAKGHRYYYGRTDDGSTSSHLTSGGQRKDLVRHVVNGLRPLVQRSISMMLSGASEMVPVAANSDAAAREQAIVSKGILEHEHREQDVEELRREALTIAMVMGEAYRAILWDAAEGEPTMLDPDTGQPAAFAGEFRNILCTPFDVYRDAGFRSPRRMPWVCFRDWQSRYELAAKYPEKAQEILAVRNEERIEDGEALMDVRWRLHERLAESDAIPVYHFYHLDSRACPGGVAFVMLNEGCWLTHGPNPYDGLPLHRLTPEGIIGTTLGYSNVFDALGLEDMASGLYSAVATNTNRFSLGTVIRKKGDGLQQSQLANGALALEVNEGKEPTPMQYPATPPDTFEHLDRLKKVLMEALGLNETAMGNPPFSGMAAQALYLLDAKAQEYQDGLAQGLRRFDAACATAELRILKAFAKDERMAVVAGKAKSWMLKAFTGESLSAVDRINVEPVKATSRNLAGKFGLLELLAQFGVQLKPEQIIDLANTGQLESQFEHEQANVLRIKAENEMLQEGKRPAVLLPRTHWLDIPEHLALLSSPSVEERPEVVQAVLDTVSEKMAAWRSMPPDLLALLGGPPPPMPPGMVPMGPGGEVLPPEAMPPQGAPEAGPSAGAPPPGTSEDVLAAQEMTPPNAA
jgi:hypothetical protein